MQGAIMGLVVQAAALPPFPADNPEQWVCSQPEVTTEAIKTWCDDHPDRGDPADLPLPDPQASLVDKNAYDISLRDWLRKHTYRDLGWISDQRWRLTGPYVGEFDSGKSYGVHPAVRVWYSPKMVDWMCSLRDGEIPAGAMIIKEMHGIKAQPLGIDTSSECIRLNQDPAKIDPESWTVMVRTPDQVADGWYWANPTASGDGNPPILSETAVTSEDFYTQTKGRNPNWYPTGDLFNQYGHLADVVTPYNMFGGLCINCHASAASGNTFSSLGNVITEGLQYKHFSTGAPAADRMRKAGAAHHQELTALTPAKKSANTGKPDWGFNHPYTETAAGFKEFFGNLGPTDFNAAMQLRLPAETWDHVTAKAGDDPGLFITSDQCIGCHDATVSNAGTPNMLVPKPSDPTTEVNMSPYAEWRASPMGLAGRDPIFFSQLQSETNNLPQMAECIENTCLHCHGVMGQRTFSADTENPDSACKDLFVNPPSDVPFGDPFRLSQVTEWDYGHGDAQYGRLARDGISCTVCHRISDDDLNSEQRFTGNFGTGPSDELYGPFSDVQTKPMQHALNNTPLKGDQIQSSALCSSCHNILLPVLSNSGSPIVIATIDGQQLTHSYEQTTGLEWVNSDFSSGDTFESCQDCHMPHDFGGERLPPQRIANIESNRFAPTDHRLPDEEITLQPRTEFARHALHGLNLFLNQMFQQFPVILGIRQIDYAGNIGPSTQPALITGEESMLAMARNETAKVMIQELQLGEDGTLTTTVEIANWAGHYLPSGVGFRRVFLEYIVYQNDEILWSSGQTNALGVIVDGATGKILPTEYGENDSTQFQPHYQTITSQDQVQIYQELIKDSDGVLTTSFLRRAHTVKDNRLRPRGFSVATYANNSSPYVQALAEELKGLPSYQDDHYSDPDKTGSDVLTYVAQLPQGSKPTHVTVRAYNQSIPPFYLQQRFNDALEGPAEKTQIERLYYLTSHLRTDSSTPIENWKVEVGQACKRLDGGGCTVAAHSTKAMASR